MAKKPDTASEKGVENPAPADSIDSASGAIIEPEIKEGVDLDHPAIDDNPRAGTSADQNKRDMNDPNRRTPADEDFSGQGLDPAPYGKASKKK